MQKRSRLVSGMIIVLLLAALVPSVSAAAATNTSFVSVTVTGGTGDFVDVELPDGEGVKIITSTGFCLTNDDGSSTWGKHSISPNLFRPHDSFWADADTGWVCGVLTWYPGPTYEMAIYETADGGSTWSKVILPFTEPWALTSIDGFWSSSLGEYCLWVAGPGATVIRSNDSGTTWVDRSITGTQNFRDIVAIGEHDAVAIDDAGSAVRWFWGGSAWAYTTPSLTTSQIMHCIDIHSSGNGIAVGNNGIIIATDDFGTTWAKTSGVSTGSFGRSQVRIVEDGSDLLAYMLDSDYGVDVFKHESTNWWIKQDDRFSSQLAGFDTRLAASSPGNIWIVDAGAAACVLDNQGPTTAQSGAEDSVSPATITLTATDPMGLGVDATYYTLNGGESTTYSSAFSVDRPGRSYVLEWWSTDNAGNVETKNTTTFDLSAAKPLAESDFVAVEGANRYATTVAASQEAFDAASTVVIATGRNWPDALGGAALAGVVEGPLLLTDPNTLPANIAEEITRLGATDAYILGGEGAVSAAVKDALSAQLSGTVDRLAGSNRYGTAQAIADKVIELQGPGYDGHAFVATGRNFPDALGASPLAAAFGQPILLAPGSGSPYLPDDTMSVTVLGGEAAVSTDVEDILKGALGAVNVERIGGSDRYSTAALVAEDGVADGMFWDGVAIATGQSFPDALSGGAMAGQLGSVMLLTRTTSLSAPAETALGANQEFIGEVHFVGGTGAVSQAVRDKVMATLGVN